MISHFNNGGMSGGMSGYTVFKTNGNGNVSVDQPESSRASFPLNRGIQNEYLKDVYEPSKSQSYKESDKDELKSIRKILEEISAKLSTQPNIQRTQEPSTRHYDEESTKRERNTTPLSAHPLFRNEYFPYNYDINSRMGAGNVNPASEGTQSGGTYNVLQACKNLHKWAKTEYSQTEGFDTVYSPQELRDRISILGEIENHINSVGAPATPPVSQPNQINERNLANYKAMRKDPDRITRHTYFEASV